MDEEEAAAITEDEEAAPTMEKEETKSMTGSAKPCCCKVLFLDERAVFEPNLFSSPLSIEV